MSARRAAVATSDVKTRDLTMQLPVVLTGDEKIEIGQALAREAQDLEDAIARKKEVGAQMTADVEAHRAQVNRKSQLLNNGYEIRDVKCVETCDFATGIATVVRKDTGEVARRREMREDELQRELPLSGAALALAVATAAGATLAGDDDDQD